MTRQPVQRAAKEEGATQPPRGGAASTADTQATSTTSGPARTRPAPAREKVLSVARASAAARPAAFPGSTRPEHSNGCLKLKHRDAPRRMPRRGEPWRGLGPSIGPRSGPRRQAAPFPPLRRPRARVHMTQRLRGGAERSGPVASVGVLAVRRPSRTCFAPTRMCYALLSRTWRTREDDELLRSGLASSRRQVNAGHSLISTSNFAESLLTHNARCI